MSPQHGLVENDEGAPLFSFGVVTDVQYADEDNKLSVKKNMRYYREALCRLRDAVQHWNSCPNGHKVNFLLQLGDVIDGLNRRKGQSQVALDRVMAEINAFNGPVHHTWGNHELYNFPREELLQMCLNSAPAEDENGRKSKSYYSFSPHPDFLIIMLDTYSKSMLGYKPEHPISRESEAFLRSVNKNDDLNDSSGLEGVEKRHSKFNGAIDEYQLKWLDRTLAEAEGKGQKVLICGKYKKVYILLSSALMIHICEWQSISDMKKWTRKWEKIHKGV